MMSESRLAWLAGILDGEGCLCISRRESGREDITFFIGNTDEGIVSSATEILREIAEELAGFVRVYLDGPKTNRSIHLKKPFWMVRIYERRTVRRVLGAVLPHLKSHKRAQAETMLLWIEQHPSRRSSIVATKR